MNGSDNDLDQLSKHFFNLPLELLAIAKIDGYFKYVNPLWEQLLGYTPEELKSRPILSFVHRDDREKTKIVFFKILEGKIITNFTNRVKTKEGGYRWLSWNGCFQKDEQLFHLIAHEINASKQAETALHLQYMLMQCMSEYDTIQASAKELLDLICEKLEWDLGILWLYDPDKNELYFENEFAKESREPLNGNKNVSGLTFKKGYGIPGTVIRTQKPLWVELGRGKEHSYDEIVPNHLFSNIFAFPIVVQNYLLGVIELFSTNKTKENPSDQTIYESIGSLLGDFIISKETERKANLLASIVESSQSAIYSEDLSGRVISWNESAQKLYGYTKQEILGRSVLFLCPENRKEEKKLIREQILAGKKIDDYETERLGKGGNTIYVSLSISPIWENNQIIGISTITQNITARKQIENELRKMNSFQKAILDNSNYMIITTNKEGIIQSFSQAAEKELGYKESELVGKMTPMVFHDLNEVEIRSEQLKKELNTSIGMGFEVFVAHAARGLIDECEWTYIRKDGTRFPVLLIITPLYNAAHEIIGFMGMARDITERKKVERMLQESEERLQSLVDTALDSIITINEDGCILFYNNSSKEIFGYPAEEVLGKNIRILLSDEDKFIDLPTDENKGNKCRQIECKRADGSIFPAEVAISHMMIDNMSQFTWITRDITEREKLNKMKSEFVSTVSHELRTPLTSITGSLSLILGGKAGQVDPASRKLLDIAHRNSERLVVLINDILDIEKIEAGKMKFNLEKIDLLDLLPQIVENNRPFAEQFGVKIQLELTKRPVWVIGDPQRLIQVFTNLLSNAIKFSPKDETVTIKIEELPGKKVKVSVIDKGPGIPKEFHTRLFQKFMQVDASDQRLRGGTGLGLSIVKMIMQKLNGKVSFTSEEGKGSTFYIEMDEVEVSKETEASPTRKVIICEDDPDAAKMLELVLRTEGFCPVIAYNAENAKKMIAKDNFEMMLLDISLPGQDGLSMIKELRDKTPLDSLPIIVVSGKQMPKDALAHHSTFPIINWLSKPVQLEQITGALENLLERVSKEKKKILHIEDDPDVHKVLKVLLKKIADVSTASTLEEARRKLSETNYDLVILDIGLPDGSGLDIFKDTPTFEATKAPVILFAATDVYESAGNIQARLVKSKTSNETLLDTVTDIINKGKSDGI